MLDYTDDCESSAKILATLVSLQVKDLRSYARESDWSKLGLTRHEGTTNFHQGPDSFSTMVKLIRAKLLSLQVKDLDQDVLKTLFSNSAAALHELYKEADSMPQGPKETLEERFDRKKAVLNKNTFPVDRQSRPALTSHGARKLRRTGKMTNRKKFSSR